MNYEDLKKNIESNVEGARLKVVRDSLFVENAADIVKVTTYLRDSEDYKLDYLSSLTGSDFLTFFETVYHLYSLEKKTGLVTLRVRCDRENPKVPSLVPVYRGAEYQEREAYDMYGIVYEGHPDLRRLFMWDEFTSFPMRKDYVQEDSETLETQDIDWCDKNGVKVPDELRKTAAELKASGKKAIASSEGKEK